jgi:hypothetical protein
VSGVLRPAEIGIEIVAEIVAVAPTAVASAIRGAEAADGMAVVTIVHGARSGLLLLRRLQSKGRLRR